MVRNFLSEAKWLNASLKASCGHHPRGPSPNKVCILTSRKMEQKMKAELDDRKRDFLLGKLRVAVRLQINFGMLPQPSRSLPPASCRRCWTLSMPQLSLQKQAWN